MVHPHGGLGRRALHQGQALGLGPLAVGAPGGVLQGAGRLGRELAWLVQGGPKALEVPEWGQLMGACLLEPIQARVSE